MRNIVDIKISDLQLLEKNPRKITKEQMNKLCESIVNDPQFLYNRPVLVNDKDDVLTVYAGNQRVRAAKSLKWKTIPCIVEKDLSDEIIKSRIVKDNKTYGTFDYDMLANEWDIETLFECGFTSTEIDGYLEKVEVDDPVLKDEKEKKLKMCPSCGHEF